MQKNLPALLLLPTLLLAAPAWSNPPSQVVRANPPAARAQTQNRLPENFRRELSQAITLVQQHQSRQALPILNRLIQQADAELRRHRNVRASGNQTHTLLLLTEAARNGKDTEVVSAEWLMPRYARAFSYVEQKNYTAAAADLDNILRIAPYEPQFLGERGQVANAQKDFATSQNIFKRLNEAARMLPDTTQAVYYQGMALRGLGYAAIERGQWQAAEQYYRQALQLNPNDRTAQNELTFVLQHRK